MPKELKRLLRQLAFKVVEYVEESGLVAVRGYRKYVNGDIMSKLRILAGEKGYILRVWMVTPHSKGWVSFFFIFEEVKSK